MRVYSPDRIVLLEKRYDDVGGRHKSEAQFRVYGSDSYTSLSDAEATHAVWVTDENGLLLNVFYVEEFAVQFLEKHYKIEPLAPLPSAPPGTLGA